MKEQVQGKKHMIDDRRVKSEEEDEIEDEQKVLFDENERDKFMVHQD